MLDIVAMSAYSPAPPKSRSSPSRPRAGAAKQSDRGRTEIAPSRCLRYHQAPHG